MGHCQFQLARHGNSFRYIAGELQSQFHLFCRSYVKGEKVLNADVVNVVQEAVPTLEAEDPNKAKLTVTSSSALVAMTISTWLSPWSEYQSPITDYKDHVICTILSKVCFIPPDQLTLLTSCSNIKSSPMAFGAALFFTRSHLCIRSLALPLTMSSDPYH